MADERRRGHRAYRGLYQDPQLGAEAPGTPQRSADPRDPYLVPMGIPARVAAEIVLDPAARQELGTFLEESFRNFQLATKGSPWMEPPWSCLAGPGSMIFEVAEISAVASSGWLDLITGAVPPGMFAFLRKFGHGVSAAAGWGDVAWRLVKRPMGAAAGGGNQTPIYPYDSWTSQIGQIDAVTDIWALVRGPATWAVQYNNSNGSDAYTVGARVDGWIYAPRVATEGATGAMVD